jgi:hypothetical protein
MREWVDVRHLDAGPLALAEDRRREEGEDAEDDADEADGDPTPIHHGYPSLERHR